MRPWGLDALAVDDHRPALIVFGFGNPHLLEGAQRRKDGATDPHAVLPLRGCDDFHLHGGRCQGTKLLGHALADARHHRGATGQDHVLIEVAPDVHIATHDGPEGGVVDSHRLLAHQAGLEQHLWAAEAFAVQRDDVPIRQLVGLRTIAALRCRLQLTVEVQGDVAKLP